MNTVMDRKGVEGGAVEWGVVEGPSHPTVPSAPKVELETPWRKEGLGELVRGKMVPSTTLAPPICSLKYLRCRFAFFAALLFASAFSFCCALRTR